MIFNINSTEEALEFGRTCAPAMIPKLHEEHETLLNLATQAQFQARYNLAIDYACKAQFIREAIEAFEARDQEKALKLFNKIGG